MRYNHEQNRSIILHSYWSPDMGTWCEDVFRLIRGSETLKGARLRLYILHRRRKAIHLCITFEIILTPLANKCGPSSGIWRDLEPLHPGPRGWWKFNRELEESERPPSSNNDDSSELYHIQRGHAFFTDPKPKCWVRNKVHISLMN